MPSSCQRSPTLCRERLYFLNHLRLSFYYQDEHTVKLATMSTYIDFSKPSLWSEFPDGAQAEDDVANAA
jgi:hypothetical protein